MTNKQLEALKLEDFDLIILTDSKSEVRTGLIVDYDKENSFIIFQDSDKDESDIIQLSEIIDIMKV